MKLHKPRTDTELIDILSKYKAPRISFENLPEVNFSEIAPYIRPKYQKIKISNWDTSAIKKLLGFGLFLRNYVEYDEDTLANLDFSNLECGNALFAFVEFNKPHHFVFPKLVDGSSLFSSAKITSPITVEAPKLVDAAFLLNDAHVEAPVNLENAYLIQDLKQAYNTSNPYKYDITYLHKYFDTPEKRKLLDKFQETLEKFNREVGPKLHRMGIHFTTLTDGDSGLAFSVNGVSTAIHVDGQTDDAIAKSLTSVPLFGVKQTVLDLLKLQRLLRIPLRKRGFSQLEPAVSLTDYHEFLFDKVILRDICPSQGVRSRDGFAFLTDYKALENGDDLPFPPSKIDKELLQTNITRYAAHFLHFAKDKAGAVEMIQQAICE